MFGSCRVAVSIVIAIVVISTSSAQFHGGDGRALNTTGAWAKYNLIVKPTATEPTIRTETTTPTSNLTSLVPAADQDPRYKTSVLKTKYNHKNEYDRPYISTHTVHIDPLSEEVDQEYHHTHHNQVEEEDDDEEDEEDEEEEITSSEEQDAEPICSTTTQRSQSIHHKAPVKIAVIATSTPKTLSGSQLKKKPGNKGGVYKPIHRPPQMPTQHPQEVIVNVNPGDIDEHEVVGPKGHKQKGVKKYKIKGLKKLRKYMLPLLLAYKLKFFTLVPLLLGGLVLIVASTGFAGFFFALFAVGVGLKKDH